MSKMRGRGKSLPNGTVIKLEKSGGINSMRCMRCKTGQASLVTRPDGVKVYKCKQCGAEYAARGMK
jgi:NMD protein affecting ribosome stability and mRNA decay